MIYCVEDDSGIRELVVYSLNNSGFQAKGFENGKELFSALEKDIPSLILLDIMLPDEDGISILKRVRKNSATHAVPIIMLTAKNEEFDKITGLDNGADDYVTKPFGIMELISRIRAVLRRSAPSVNADEFSFEGVTINSKSHNVFVNSKPVELTYKEFELLLILMKNQGAVLTRDMLLENVWGIDYLGESRTVDVHIRTLRTKLCECGEIIETVRGVGYRIGGAK